MTSELRTRADAGRLEALLRADPAVDDCWVFRRRDLEGTDRVLAFVVPRGAFSPQHFTESWQRIARDLPEAVLPVPVSCLPLDDEGGRDAAALDRIAVVDEATARLWEERWSELEEGAGVVALRPHEPRELPVHFDALPGAEPPSAADTAGEPEGRRRDDGDRAATDRPAIVHGGELQGRAADPDDLPAALQQAAGAAEEAAIGHLAADRSVEWQSYGELLDEGRRCLTGLREAGLGSGDPVLLQVAASRDYFAALWGCLLGGLVPVPVAVPPGYDRDNAGTGRLESAWHLFAGAPVLTTEDLAPAIAGWAGRRGLDGLRPLSLTDLLARPAADELHRPDPDDTAFVLLTSGSTGRPKGVPLTHRNVLVQARAMAQHNGLGRDDVSLNWMPLDHVGGLVAFHLRAVFLGCRQLHGPTEAVLQDPLLWLDWVDEHRITSNWAPNFAFGLVNEYADEVAGRSWDLSSLRVMINAGEAIVARTARRFLTLLEPHGLPATAIHPAFGMSETSSGVAHSHRFRLDTTSDEDPFVALGEPMAATSLRIADDDGEVMREGRVGRVQVRGATVTPGYHDDPDANAEAFTADGWFDTGDLGFIVDGQLTISGRRKDVIIINGANYYSHEIEAVVEELPGVVVSCTAACPVRPAGAESDRLAIFLSTHLEGWDAKLALFHEVREAVLREVGLRPAHVVALPESEIPKTGVGKIQRSALRRRFEAGEMAGVVRDIEVHEGGARTLPRWLYAPTWRRREAASPRPTPADRLLVLPAGEPADGMADALAALLPGRTWVARFADGAAPEASTAGAGDLELTLDPSQREARRWLAARCSAAELRPQAVIHLGSRRRLDGAARAEELVAIQERRADGFLELLSLLSELFGADASQRRLHLLVATTAARAVAATEAADPTWASVLALLRTAAQEHPWLRTRAVDVADGATPEDRAACLVAELATHDGEEESAWRRGRRAVPRLRRLDLEIEEPTASLPVTGGLYAITGGLGEVGAEVAAWLMGRHGARLLLLGRSARPDGAGGKAAALRRLEGLGEVIYESVDVTDRAALEAAVEKAEARWERSLDGAFHLAGAYHERRLEDETASGLAKVSRPKVLGAVHLRDVLRARAGGCLVLFSSLAGSFGVAGLGAYAAANRGLDALAEACRGDGVEVRSLAWSTWRGLGLARHGAGDELARIRGFLSMDRERAVATLATALHHPEPVLLAGLDGHHHGIRARRLEAYGLTELVAYHTGASAPPPPRDRFGNRPATTLVLRDSLPRTDDGDVDRDALLRGADAGGPPRGELEEALAAVWIDVLDLESLRRDDHFFTLGGDSLLGTRMLNRVRHELGVGLEMRDLFRAPSLVAFAARVEEERGEGGGAETGGPSAEGVEELDAEEAAALLDRVDELPEAEVERLLAVLGEGEGP